MDADTHAVSVSLSAKKMAETNELLEERPLEYGEARARQVQSWQKNL